MVFVCVMEDNLVYCMLLNHILLSVKPSPLLLLVFLYGAAFYPTNCCCMWMKNKVILIHTTTSTSLCLLPTTVEQYWDPSKVSKMHNPSVLFMGFYFFYFIRAKSSTIWFVLHWWGSTSTKHLNFPQRAGPGPGPGLVPDPFLEQLMALICRHCHAQQNAFQFSPLGWSSSSTTLRFHKERM